MNLQAKPQVVIIGGGFGGITVARALRKAPAQITLVDRSNHHLFQPLLYQVATAALSPADIAAPIRSVLRGSPNTEVLMAAVHGLDLKNRLVLTSHHSIQYDYLVLATGSTYSYFGHDDWAQFAPGLKSIVDATRIRRKILLAFEAAEIESDTEKRKACLTFVLVGAGPTGVEMAGSIAELAYQALRSDFRHIDPRLTRIILIEAGPRILSGFSDSSARKARKKLESLGVEIRLNTRVAQIDPIGVTINGARIEARSMIWCAGVVASPAGKWLNAEVDRTGRVKVNPDLTVPGHPEIYVIGDTASVIQEGKPLPGVAPVAMQEGRFVSAMIKRRLRGAPADFEFRYFNKGNLATVGRSFAIAEFGRIHLAGLFAWLTWTVVHIYYLIGFRSRVLIMMEWAWAYFTFQRGARLITLENENEMP